MLNSLRPDLSQAFKIESDTESIYRNAYRTIVIADVGAYSPIT